MESLEDQFIATLGKLTDKLGVIALLEQRLAVLDRIEKLLTRRRYTDQTYVIGNTQSNLYLDYKKYTHLYMLSPQALTLNLQDGGQLQVPAGIWTCIDYRENFQLFTTNQANPIPVTVRATDDIIAVSGAFGLLGSITATNPSVGTDGSAGPTSSTQIGGQDSGGHLQPLQVDGSKNLLVALGAALPAGTNVIGHVIVDSAGNVSITSLPSLPAGTNVIGHVITDTNSVTDVVDRWARQVGQVDLARLLGSTIGLTNEVPVANVSNGEIAISSPADGSTITLNTDTIITFASTVQRIRLQNEHATAKVYWRTGVSSTAFNLVPPGSNLVEWVGIATTTMHIYSDTTLTNLFNAAGGFKVRGYA